jgi:hypothetical protein
MPHQITVANPIGTAYSSVKGAIVHLLQSSTSLQESGTIVSYETPANQTDIRTDKGKYEAIYFDDAGTGIGPVTGDSKQDNVIICSLPLRIEEEFTLPLWIVVLEPNRDDTQEAADRRVDELLFEVMKEIASYPTLGLENVPEFDYLQVTKASQYERRTGFLREDAPGRGASARYYLHVKCRLNVSRREQEG